MNTSYYYLNIILCKIDSKISFYVTYTNYIKMSNRIESIMKNRAALLNGWTQTVVEGNKTIRSIRIGSQTNCNGDELICDETTYDKMKSILEKHDIKDFVLANIRNETEFSTEVQLDETQYTNFVKKLECN
jgi:hypothetical protein